MLDFAIGIFIFIGIIAVTALLFSGWALYGVIRAVITGVGRLFYSPSPARSPSLPLQPGGTNRCPRTRCHATNPANALFCRRCGCSLAAAALGAGAAQRHRQSFATHTAAGQPPDRIAS